MNREDEAINEIARRLAAAYVSYTAGYAGVDILLKRTPERAGKRWIELATFAQNQAMTNQKTPKTFWPNTTLPYGEETAFVAAKVYAQTIHDAERNAVPYNRLNDLVVRAVKLLRQVSEQSPSWQDEYNQWLKDAGF